MTQRWTWKGAVFLTAVGACPSMLTVRPEGVLTVAWAVLNRESGAGSAVEEAGSPCALGVSSPWLPLNTMFHSSHGLP